MMDTIKFVIVENSDGSIITCPKSDLKENPWLFTAKKKTVLKFNCFDGMDKQKFDLAHKIHNVYVSLTDESKKAKFISAMNDSGFNARVIWFFNSKLHDFEPAQ